MSQEERGWFGTATLAEPATVGEVSYLEALRWSLHDLLESDPSVVVLGEDIGEMGGAFRVTEGLFERFGGERVIDTPMAEIALVGAGIGLAISGWRPIVELQFADFISVAYDQLVNEAAKLHYRFEIAVPLVVRCPSGGGLAAGPFHSQSPEGVFAHIPGLKVVCPATPQDAYDLLRAAVVDPDPVLFFEQKQLYRSLRGQLERHTPFEQLGRAAVRRHGAHVTVVSYGAMVPRCLEAARQLADEGVEATVIDLRTLVPLDIDTVAESVVATGRVVVVHEDTRNAGFGAEIAARLVESEVFFALDAPIARVTAPDTAVPFAAELEDRYVPSVDRIRDAVRRLARS